MSNAGQAEGRNMTSWRDLVGARDREILAAAGYGHAVGLGVAPALLVVDVTYGFLGRVPLPVLEAIRAYPGAVGEAGWEAVAIIERLLAAARGTGVPVLYSAGTGAPGRWAQKRPSHVRQPADAYEIVDRLAPRPGETVIRKAKPSAFFGSGLGERLKELGVDSLIVCGGTTSGCVRATVVDAFSHDLRVAVVEDAVFDRVQLSHAAALLDMEQKYADVLASGIVVAWLEARASRQHPAHAEG
jgi:maleamate amidohydrolase